MENRFRSKRFAWTDKAVEVLLHIWAANIVNLRAAKRKSHIYRDMRSKMIEHKIICDVSDIANKIKNLSQKYRAEKKLQDSSSFASDWKWYEAIDRVITGQPLRDLNLKKEMMNNFEPCSRYFPDEIIKCEMNFDDNTSCESNQSQLSPSCIPGSESSVKKKSKLAHIYQEMIDEIRKINQIEKERKMREEKFYELSAEFMKKSLEKQDQANKLSEHSIALAKDNLEIQKLILNAVLQN